MNNARIADVLDELADLLEFKGENPFRVRAYRNGSRAIRALSESVSAILKDPDRKLTSLDGIGKGVAEKCEILVETGELPQLQQLLAEVPESVLALLKIPRLGPKKAAALHRELGIATLEQLKAACEAKQVRELSGFGAKTEQTILAGLGIAASAGRRIYWADADAVAQELRLHLSTCGSLTKLELAGSYRRGRETVGDLDILVVSEDVDEIMDRLEAFPERTDTLARGGTKMSIRLSGGLQVDLRVVPEASFGAALQYFTGSKEHNVVLRGRAKQRGLKINEYGVYRIDGEAETYLAGASEQDVYATLDLPYFPPELREARQEFDWADAGELPKLIEQADIRGDLHMHTTATDGKASLEEMVQAACDRKLQYIAITDHSQRVSMAFGLDEGRLLAQWKTIDDTRPRFDQIRILKGIEVDILERGGLDIRDDVLAQADWVLASVHYGQKQSRQQITDRICEALENPHVTGIAHPTGRMINRREAYDVDLEAVFQAARENHKVLELNSNPARLDLHDLHCAAAKAAGIPIVINTDAHSTQALDVMRYGILQARRAGLTAQDVINTLPCDEFLERIGKAG